MILRRARAAAASAVPTLAFCERVTAGPFTPWHIRRVGVEGLKLGGGAPDTVLCGAELRHGWDRELAVDTASVERLLRPDDKGRTAVCVACAVAFKIISGTTGPTDAAMED